MAFPIAVATGEGAMVLEKSGKTFRDMLECSGFYCGVELVTSRGYADAAPGARLMELAAALAGDPRIGWISLTDNPGGNPMLPPDALARRIISSGSQCVIHLTCKDANRNGLESAAWRLAGAGLWNVLAITGDLPSAGQRGVARGVFDIDSAALIKMLSDMNAGLQAPGRKPGEMLMLPQTQFYIGCAVSPFKRLEQELIPQYFKLARKIRSGAQWVIPQLGYDMRKFHEIKLFLEWTHLTRPLIGNVYVLNKTVTGMFNANRIPGCVVSDELKELCEKQAASPDKGAKFFRELAAKQLAVFKGLGFSAGYLAGASKAETFFNIIEMAESFAPDDWKEFAKEIQFARPDEFYLFERDPQSGLGIPGQLNAQYLKSLESPAKTANVTLGYRLSRAAHRRVFTPGTHGFGLAKAIYQKLDARPDGPAARTLHAVERASKALAFGCRDCGDCSLPECAYLCPRASCSKAGRNGPCGGSFDGQCEAGDKQCIWVRAYERMKYYGETEQLLAGEASFVDGQLDGTSAWANALLGRDHLSKDHH